MNLNAAEITAICTGVPAIIGAVTALVIAIKSKGQSAATLSALANHLTSEDHPQ